MVTLLVLAEPAISLSTAGYSEQASVGSWPLRIGLTVGVLLAVLLVLAAFRRGWRRRRESQTGVGLGAFPTRTGSAFREPESEQDSFHAKYTFSVKYIGTAKSDDRFTRIIAGGGPAQARLVVSDPGIEIDRQGERPLYIDTEAIINAGSGKGLLQKAYARHGLLMVTWRWDDQEVVSGFWLAEKDEHNRAMAAIERLATAPRTTSAAMGPGEMKGPGTLEGPGALKEGQQ